MALKRRRMQPALDSLRRLCHRERLWSSRCLAVFCSTRACVDFSDCKEVRSEATEIVSTARGTMGSNKGSLYVVMMVRRSGASTIALGSLPGTDSCGKNRFVQSVSMAHSSCGRRRAQGRDIRRIAIPARETAEQISQSPIAWPAVSSCRAGWRRRSGVFQGPRAIRPSG